MSRSTDGVHQQVMDEFSLAPVLQSLLRSQASIESMQSSDSRLCYLTSSEVSTFLILLTQLYPRTSRNIFIQSRWVHDEKWKNTILLLLSLSHSYYIIYELEAVIFVSKNKMLKVQLQNWNLVKILYKITFWRIFILKLWNVKSNIFSFIMTTFQLFILFAG